MLKLPYWNIFTDNHFMWGINIWNSDRTGSVWNIYGSLGHFTDHEKAQSSWLKQELLWAYPDLSFAAQTSLSISKRPHRGLLQQICKLAIFLKFCISKNCLLANWRQRQSYVWKFALEALWWGLTRSTFNENLTILFDYQKPKNLIIVRMRYWIRKDKRQYGFQWELQNFPSRLTGCL